MPAAQRISAFPRSIENKRDNETLTALIGGIYDAALDPAAWYDVLSGIAEFVGGQACGFLSKDAASDFLNVEHHIGVSPHYLRSYAENFSRADPLLMVPTCDVARIVSIPELVPFDEYRESRFYREWAQPQGWLDVANAVLDKSGANCIIFSVVRDDARGLVDAEARRRLALFIPHMRRAALVRSAIDRRQAETAAFAATLDGLSAGLLLVDAEGRIVHANIAGRSVLDGDDFLRSTGGQLVARDAAVHRTLRELFAAAGNGDDIGRHGIALPLVAQDGERHVAHVLPLSQETRARAGLGGQAVAAVFVRKAALAGASPAEVIGKAFGLTPAELRVLLAIVDVGGVPEVASFLGVAESTVKTHLSRLFEKTGAARQADLVKLVAGFATPLAH